MPSSPLVSIVLAVYNDEAWIEKALESCAQQTLEQIEIICVDDASTDRTPELVEEFHRRDPRVRLIRQERNQSAFQARRVGIAAATAPYVLFLDGDDELDPRAAARAHAKAQATEADLVGFGVEVLDSDGRSVGGYQTRLQPVHKSLEGAGVLQGLFPVGRPAQGQLWRYLFSTELLRRAYAQLPEDLVLYRINDLPITFLAAALAQRYVAISDRLYRYFFRRGGSGHHVTELSQFMYYLGAIDSVDSVRPAVRALAHTSPDPEVLLEAYESARLSILGNIVGYLQGSVSEELHAAGIEMLYAKAPAHDVVLAAATYCPGALEILAAHGPRTEIAGRTVRHVLLTTKTLRTGGVSGVLLSQAHYLTQAGYRVTIATHGSDNDTQGVPDGVPVIEMSGTPAERLLAWADLCRVESVDVIIDHQILYNKSWPAFVLMAQAEGVPTIGWIHNFALRPIYDRSDMSSFLEKNLHALATLVTLSPLDAVFWKLRGISHATYLPNPPSPMILESAGTVAARSEPQRPIELIWWGRLEQHTKQVLQLVEVAGWLQRLSVDFRLKIIGPDWGDMSVERLADAVEEAGLSDRVSVVGPLRGQDLLDAIDAADLFVNTSIIEGYPLTLAEAQTRGLPVVMYDMPWLMLTTDNEGVITVPQGDAAGLARQIAWIAEDPELYARLSEASIQAAGRLGAFDFALAYEQVVTGTLPAEFSPEPTLDDAQRLIDLMVFFAERDTQPRTKKGKRDAGSASSLPQAAPVSPLRKTARRLYRVVPGLKPIARRVKPFARRVKRTLSR